MAPSKLIVVLGATGGQGNSVVEAFLTEKDYIIRGVTRQPQSEKAQALSKKGVEVVEADNNDEASLVKAFEGASAIFAMTDFFEPFAKHGPHKAIEIEQKQGENIARAASKTAGLQHFLWSTLPDGNTLTKGKFVIPHFEAKNRINRFIQNDKALLAKTTFLWFGFYTENLFYPIFTPIYVKSAQKFIQLSPADPSTPIWSVGDHRTNTGIFARAIVKNPPKDGGTFVRCFAEYHSSLNDYLAVWGRASGLSPSAGSTMVVKVSLHEYSQLWPGWGEEMGSMMAMWSALRERSWAGLDGDHVLDIDNILSADDRKSVIKTEAAFRALDWKKIL
ncbi:hypothetical protein Asppvi_009469 [Aspergillus pseudoviridinutans]|uniref:NmrA-like domain-containing protein n=1 Tax=Aspergillus pseudoviridinutans TaxID=1517512 RepID=A0A9P3BLH5_9EURO|nr:uncharacterized protein Asppvi_009469 [Aspergillus pseudoviridinutans]GIJ90513.1 hypothetical protein Asppvi_009469 [Aspergillus pseudoviridinutans]